VREFPPILGPEVVFEMALRQRERATEKAVARHERRKRLGSNLIRTPRCC
jgi:hypothetical protein